MAKSKIHNCPLEPLEDRVVIEMPEKEEKTKSGIYLPKSAQTPPPIARVLAVGPGLTADNGTILPMYVKPGDMVVLANHAGHVIEIDKVDYIVVSQRDIIAKTK